MKLQLSSYVAVYVATNQVYLHVAMFVWYAYI